MKILRSEYILVMPKTKIRNFEKFFNLNIMIPNVVHNAVASGF